MEALPQNDMSIEEFFDAIEHVEGRFELVDGQPMMMDGATNQHNNIKNNITVALTPAARRRGCNSTTSDTGVQTGERSVRLPDVVVDCGSSDPNGKTIANPTIIVEVSSPGIRSSDVGVKLAEYQGLASVRIVIQVEPDVVFAAVHSRGDDNAWQVRVYDSLDDEIPIPSLEATLAFRDIYYGMNIKPRPRLQLVQEDNTFTP